MTSSGLAWLRARGTEVARTWRRSLQFRVAATTVVVTGGIVLFIGLFLVDQISSGVLRAKRDAAIAQASATLDSARVQFQGVAPGDHVGIQQAADGIRTGLAISGTSAGLFTIVVRSPDESIDTELAASEHLAIPDSLRQLVKRGNLAVTYAPVLAPTHTVPGPGLIVGAPVTTSAGSFELYYLFPLNAEADTIRLVQRTVVIASIALVALVAAMAIMVTRQVVRPVRVAARTSKLLAGGDLAQRIEVHGEDDIALLAESFNEMAESLQRQIGKLEELSRLQQRFTSDVSHELRTPLTTVRMAAELLYNERHMFSPELARSTELLNNELDRFENLLADLLEISRYDAGVAHLESERVDLAGVVERAVRASEVIAERQGVDLSLDIAQRPAFADVDARRVERIVRNLVGNAIDHAEGRPVNVRLAGNSEAVAISVQDHGVGLRPGEARLVFNRFWRGDPSRSRLTGGTGLGLAISLEDARLHGGWLDAWGEKGVGSVFRLTLPRTSGATLVESPLPLGPSDAPAADEVRQT